MYLIREVLHCKPGKVRPMVEKFKVISTVLKEKGQEPLRLLTDVTGEPVLDHRRRSNRTGHRRFLRHGRTADGQRDPSKSDG